MAVTKNYMLVMYGVSIEVDTTPDGENPTWALLAEGISNISESLNEVKQQTYYLSDRGYGHTEVTGQHPTFTLTGNRAYNDTAQNYIFGLKHKLGCHRKTQMRITVVNTCDDTTLYARYLADCTICDLQEYSGSAEGLSDISITLEMNGRPKEVPSMPTITITGDGTSSVSITITSTMDGATIYYTTDGTVPTVAGGTQYEGVVTLTTTGSYTIKAIAVSPDDIVSEVASKTCTVA